MRPEVPRGEGVIREDLEEGEGGALKEVSRDVVEKMIEDLRGQAKEKRSACWRRVSMHVLREERGGGTRVRIVVTSGVEVAKYLCGDFEASLCSQDDNGSMLSREEARNARRPDWINNCDGCHCMYTYMRTCEPAQRAEGDRSPFPVIHSSTTSDPSSAIRPNLFFPSSILEFPSPSH